jgi:gamma-glutamylcyclotransferase (GGCT)/AIG2-like uncharacterized protein YtfP
MAGPAESSAGIGSLHLFVYGSLVDPRCLDEVLGRRFDGERLRARLDGFTRAATDGWDYPFLVADADGASVDGVLIMDLSPSDLATLDRYEDVTEGMYERITVEVAAWGCGPRPALLRAQTYIGGPRLRSTAA